jgi:exosortase
MTAFALRRPRWVAEGASLPLGLGLVLVVAWVFVLRELAAVWWNVPYYSHALLVPLFSAWLIMDEVRSGPPGSPAPLPGALLLVVAAGALLAGITAGSLPLRALSIVPGAFGVALLARGAAGTRAVAFPLGFLVFMVPLPDAVLPRLSLELQQIAAGFAALALPALGIPAVPDGLFIHLPADVVLHVSEDCNGMRFLFAMLAVGTAFAGTVLHTCARRALTVALAVVTAIAANGVRVTGTGVIAYTWGPEAASGFLHLAYGKAVYAVMLVPFAALVLLLRRGERRVRP